MLAALDVHYRQDGATAAAVVFAEWTAATAVAEYRVQTTALADYAPGEFYRRELAPLLAVIAAVREPVHTWIIDGYCQLSPQGAPGLGAHLHAVLAAGTGVVGVAKKVFHSASHAIPVLRGGSQRPLFVTAIGTAPEVAARAVALMHGAHRLPALLQRVDQVSRAPP